MILVVGILVGAAILISVTYLAARMFAGLVNTPPTPLTVLYDQPREQAVLEGMEVLQLRVSPGGNLLAALAVKEGEPGSRMFIYRLEKGELTPLLDFPVKGYGMDWMEDDGRPFLIYEDAGDIWQFDPEGSEPLNLTSGDPFYDSDPLSSADGAVLLFKRMPTEGEGRPELWALFSEKGEMVKIAPWRGEPRLSPDNYHIAATFPLEGSPSAGPADYQIELFDLEGKNERLITLRRREFLHLEWEDPDHLLLVCLYRPQDGSGARGVVYSREVRNRGEERAIGTLRSIREKDRACPFRMDREGKRLAYLGSSGLEYFDLEERRIYREESVTGLDALDWLPGGEGLVFSRDGIIYSLNFAR